LIAAALGSMVRRVPGPFLALAVVFAGIMSSLAVDAGYVVLVPLGAAIFAAAGRHPIAGLAAAFAGVSAGFSANLLVTALDPLLGGISQLAAQMLVPDYTVLATANWFLMIGLVPAFSIAGAFVTSRIIEPRLGTWEPNADAPVAPHAESADERRALKITGLATLVLIAIIAALTVPENAILRDPETGSLDPFFQAIVAITMLALAGLGIVYGGAMGSIRKSEDAIAMASDAMAAMASYILLAFVAAHFLALFAWSNLGVLLAIGGGQLLQASGLGGVPLLMAMILVSGFINLFVGSASAKWAILAPIFIPMFMLVGITPEATQAAYRIGDSVTNIITPLLVYFPLILVAAQRYVPKLGIGSLIATMMPHSIAFLIAGSAVLLTFLLFEIPLGPGTSVMMTPVAPPAAVAPPPG
ncbi:MAG: AbgT family transporter, partial [Thermaurantiacus sp.]